MTPEQPRSPSPLTGTFPQLAEVTLPWWRVRMVWLVLSGPAVVVVASLVTAVVAYRGADPVLVDTASTRHVPDAQRSTQPTGDTPALVARNHAATASAPAPAPAPAPADP